MRALLWIAALLLMAGPALAQNAPQLVPCASISPQAVTAVPAPFDHDMKLICYDSAGQGLVPPDGTHWVDGHMDVALAAMDDRLGPDGKPPTVLAWYVSLKPRQISPANVIISIAKRYTLP